MLSRVPICLSVLCVYIRAASGGVHVCLCSLVYVFDRCVCVFVHIHVHVCACVYVCLLAECSPD